ncbi:toxic anion resistance protein [Mobiluncus mulieris]|uniref:Toxic anion resistance protein n=1 Tax=Mobiluncus mulieris TaxID=2052 RepID=A0ABD4TZT5_9ACTO|nr:toxic anion resistance protein [Mobiluncus mulieris]MCU9969592.1 toxic anion resistance protein [Mobiluncus mulieris]MCU9972495.1 toxic anion resistance protein [Mobiluncus mulieris]MCV0009944.1 toxic anion resistance protein [Mobiluncus mulieris]MCV0012430.1 toxic anion resistance protein [Mobiluncus mulieris]NMW81995.1 toxic anion resistance protein [Mobiluncus mulieris]
MAPHESTKITRTKTDKPLLSNNKERTVSDISLDDLMKKTPVNTATTEVPTEEKALELVKRDIPELSAVDEQKISEIRAEINLQDTSTLALYGTGAQKNIAEFSDSILSQVKAKDGGEVGQMLTDMLVQVQNSKPTSGGFLAKMFGKGKTEVQRFMASYETLSQQLDAIAARLESKQKEMTTQIAVFDKMYAQNLDYYHNLTLYIEAGEREIQDLRENTLPRLREEAKNSGDMMAVQAVADFEANVGRFEKKVHDLKISQTLSLQTAPQIKLIQQNDQLLVEKINDVIHSTLPLWRSQTVIALGLQKQRDALAVEKAVSDATNEMIRQNAAQLKQTTLEVRQEAERSTVDIETLEAANQDLIETIHSSVEITRQAAASRVAASQKMLQMKADLKQALIAASTGNTGSATAPDTSGGASPTV